MSVGTESSLVRVPKAGELVAAKLRRQIVTGELKPGDPLPGESALMERYGVSRPTMREAFRILESESIIVVLRGAHGGARVLAPDESVAARHMGLLLQYQGVALADVYRARTEVEIAALRAWGGNEPDLKRLTELVEEGRSLLGDPVGFAKLDTRIHQAIVDLAGSQTMSIMMGMLLHIMDAHNRLYIVTHGPEHELVVDQLAYRSYRRLLKLLREGDVDSAVAHWLRHLRKVANVMLDDSGTTLVEVLS
ncbi:MULTISPECIES: FadR/GntR family transcriptional regulator [unclassified Rhodococcus (in: high G+C Gram-positive bacteria)]|jgi:DNA-binding FadR family transcriptional regulator|uniref:FadR/GntR family transcriptional regulator n=1 Tax=unclassified Rhodococcus (in: high G+C Gram-positive bacteria) TaxID=192944 RepID=UPI00131F6E51|nr:MULTISPECIES: GntR family transcriptional regulator [Rhodococcus]QHE70308.1 Transcriptional regulator, GntR family [Rhodococcus sp. WAY2]GLK34295.1 GntR family transcriptional regulator [Rhodococcus wratislaviensis]